MRDAITEGLDLTSKITKTKARLDNGWAWFVTRDDTHPKWEENTDRYLAELKAYEKLVDQRNEIEEGLSNGSG